MTIARTALALAAAGAGALAAACGDTGEAPGPPPLATTTPRKDVPPDSDASGPHDASVPDDVGPGATTYKGTLDATRPVKFGGTYGTSFFCEYTVTLKNIEVEVAALDSGDVIGAVAHDLAVEAIVATDPPCPYAPQAPSAQSFALTTATKTSAGMTLAFEGAASNRPRTSFVIDLARVGVTYEASVGWKRTDQTPPLDWAVTAKIVLAPR